MWDSFHNRLRLDNVFYFDFIMEKSAILNENLMNNLANVKPLYLPKLYLLGLSQILRRSNS